MQTADSRRHRIYTVNRERLIIARLLCLLRVAQQHGDAPLVRLPARYAARAAKVGDVA